MDRLVLLDQPVRRGHRELAVSPDRKVRPAQRGHKELQANPDHKALKVLPQQLYPQRWSSFPPRRHR